MTPSATTDGVRLAVAVNAAVMHADAFTLKSVQVDGSTTRIVEFMYAHGSSAVAVNDGPGDSYAAVRMGDKVWVNGDANFWQPHCIPPTPAQMQQLKPLFTQVATHWVDVTALPNLAEDLIGQFPPTAIDDATNQTNLGLKTVDGVSVIELQDSTSQAITYVRADPTVRPLKAILAKGSVTNTWTFDQPISVTAPPGSPPAAPAAFDGVCH